MFFVALNVPSKGPQIARRSCTCSQVSLYSSILQTPKYDQNTCALPNTSDVSWNRFGIQKDTKTKTSFKTHKQNHIYIYKPIFKQICIY